MSQATRDNLRTKLAAFHVALNERRNRYRRPEDPPREIDNEERAANELLDAAITTLFETHALVEALAAKKGIRR